MVHARSFFRPVMFLLFFAGVAPAADPHAQYQRGRQLEQEGQHDRAFLEFAASPGCQHLAARLGRSEPARYLALLQAAGDKIARPLAKAVQADLHLALGDKEAALACCRAVAACVSTDPDASWESGKIPSDSYLAEPPAQRDGDFYGDGPIAAFTRGPGSHRDNWLIRRLIALEALGEARAEFARVWEIHRRNAEPYVFELPMFRPGGEPVRTRQLAQPAGFDGRGLQFAIDYAFFLRKVGEPAASLRILREPLLAMDLDRDPNRPRIVVPDAVADARYRVRRTPIPPPGPWPVGIARKEFLRLAFGLFKDSGQLETLVEDLQQRIDQGENRLRRVLARIRMLEGLPEESLALELTYLDDADCGLLTKVCRRGQVLEEAGRNAEAVAEYERALSLPLEAVAWPDPEEITNRNPMQQAAMPLVPGVASPSGAALHADLAARLTRLYDALGQPEKAFAAELRGMVSDPRGLADVNRLQAARTRAEIFHRQDAFRAWLRKQVQPSTAADVQAAVAWVLEDYETCIAALVRSWQPAQAGSGEPASFRPWRERFAGLGTDRLQQLLQAILAVDPGNSRLRLELLDLTGAWGGEPTIAALEMLLDSQADTAFVRGKGDYNRTQFRNYFDLAYRLMRLYQRHDRLDRLQALGLRIASGEKPFGAWWERDLTTDGSMYEVSSQDDLNRCLALLIHLADDATLTGLQAMWQPRSDFPAKRQLARRLSGRFVSDEPRADVGWANVPGGVRAIAAQRNVLCLASDDRYFYAGQPWGVAVYEHSGRPITRLAIGQAVLALAATDSAVWAGTPKGLYRIRRGNENPRSQTGSDEEAEATLGWDVAHLWLHGDVSEQERHSRSFAGAADYWFDNAVHSLAVDGDELWIGMHRNVQRLNTRTMALRAYSLRELQLDHWGGFEHLLVDGPYVWADCSQGMRRYDRQSDTWQPVVHGGRGVGLIGRIDGVLFGHVWLNDQLRDRPCLVDRQTLAVQPLLIEGNLSDSQRMINGPFSFYGSYQGKPVFGDGYPAFFYDESIGRLRPIGDPWQGPRMPIDSVLPAEMQHGRLQWSVPVNSFGQPAAEGGEEEGRPKPGLQQEERLKPGLQRGIVWQADGPGWSLLQLPDGRKIAGRRRSQAPRYQYPQEDWPFQTIPWQREAGDGGLFLVDAGGGKQRISPELAGDVIPGEVVFSVVEDRHHQQLWLCTDLGLVLMDSADRVRASFTESDGLPGQRIISGFADGEHGFFACGWGDHAGGLAVANRGTSVFTGFFQGDGLATNKLARVLPAGEHLQLLYDVEYERFGDFRYRQFPPGSFDPSTGRIQSGGEAAFIDQNEAARRIAARDGGPQRWMPYLGGFVIAEQQIGGRRYLCGTRGLVVIDGEPPPLQMTQLTSSVQIDPHVRWQQEARAVPIPAAAPELLRELSHHANPYVRHRALESARWPARQQPAPYVPVLKSMVGDAHGPNRRIVAELLGASGDESCVPLLQRLLNDPDPAVQEQAALSLARLGRRTEIGRYAGILQRHGQTSDKQLEVLQSLAPTADAEVFALLLEHPLVADDYEPRQAVFAQLGRSLVRHPEAADALLRAYTRPQDPGPESNYGAARFAQEVFRHAGEPLLPRLHAALASPDRVVRSNAARACGAIRHRSSIAPLLAALDLESGLSRASIVWALGELQAAEALPRLVTLYTDASLDQRRERGTGYRTAQAAAQIESQLAVVGRIDEIAVEWDELKQLAEPAPIDPRRDEPLLTTAVILAAVQKIGPQASREFYRRLAGESDTEARLEAARRLGEGAESDRAQNLLILRGLLASRDTSVRMAAAVSLLILDQDDVRPQILAWLGADRSGEAAQIARELERVADGQRLVFAREAIARRAAAVSMNPYERQLFQRLLQRIPDNGAKRSP